MIEKNKLLSVIIPTKNRQKYCIKTINHLLSFKDEELEIIVKDNSDNEDIGRYFEKEIAENKINYYYSTEKFSMSENFESALNLINGDYFIFIGDDDSLNPAITHIVKEFKEKNALAIVQRYPIYYVYPNKALNTNGVLSFYNNNSKIDIIDTEKELLKLTQNAFQKYLYTGLPRPYHGIVNTKILKVLKQNNLTLFGSISPDIYSTIILSKFIKECYVINYSFSIAGACPSSGSSKGTNNAHNGRLEDAFHFKDRNIIWSERIPRIYSVETVWAFAAIEALKALNKTKYIAMFNYHKLTGKVLANNASIKKIIFEEYCKMKDHNLLLLFGYFSLSFIQKYLSKIRSRIYIYTKSLHIYNKIESFEQVIDIFSKVCKVKI